MEDKSYRLIIAYFEKTISDDGLTFLQEWIERSPDNLDQFIETIQILEASKSFFKHADREEENWQLVQSKLSMPNGSAKPVFKMRGFIYAAACTVACLLSFLFYKHHNKKVILADYAEVSNPDGQHSKVVLPDSSIVYLSGGSRIKYARHFLGAKRTVLLEGEAFFDVVHQSKRPFVVKSGSIETVVLGTSFNVKAFTAENKVAITVKTGKVGVLSSGTGKQEFVKFLLPDEQIEINTLSGLYTFSKIDASAVAAWKDNHFVFYNTPLREIVSSLEHHYGVKIEFTDPELGNSRLTAKFNTISIEAVMSNLATLSGMAYTQKGDHIFISDNDQKGGRIMK
jgi:transmembrane sensor